MSEEIPLTISSLQKLLQLPLKKECTWNVFAYCIHDDIIKEDGSLEEDRALVFLLGSFKHIADAEEHVKYVMEKTGYAHIIIAKYGMPVKITTKRDDNVIEQITTDLTGKIIKMDTQNLKKQQALYEDKVKMEQALIEESKQENNQDSIEYFKRKAHLATKYLTNSIELEKKAESFKQQYQEQKVLLKDHLSKYPEHEAQFLPYLKDKLLMRGEDELYYNIEHHYIKYREQILQ
jgi:hypothetical protein